MAERDRPHPHPRGGICLTLLAYQQAYARLLADAYWREAYLADPTFPLPEYAHLSPAERDRLAALDRDTLVPVAALLHLDRLNAIRQHAPWTFQALAVKAPGVVAAFADAFPSREATPLRETSRFLRWLLAKGRRPRQGVAPWAEAAATYERYVLRLQLAPEREAPFLTFSRNPERHPLAMGIDLPFDLVPLVTGDGPPLRHRTGYVFHRRSGSRAVSVYRTKPWVARLVHLADGSRDLGTLVTEVAEPGLTLETLAAAVDTAVAQGVLSVSSQADGNAGRGADSRRSPRGEAPSGTVAPGRHKAFTLS